MRETLRWLDACQDFRHIKPILTPRFTPSCTNELIGIFGDSWAAERDLPCAVTTCRKTARRWTGYANSTGLQTVLGDLQEVRLWNDRTVMCPLRLVGRAGAAGHEWTPE